MTNRLVDGDIVFARTGATTGKSFLVRNPPRAVFASYLIRLRVRESVLPDFLWHFFQSGGYWRQIRAKARGGIQPGFNATMLEELLVPLPPLPEQRRIAARLKEQLAAVEQARASARAQAEELDALVAAALRDSLSGECVPLAAGDILDEVNHGVGPRWREFPVIGATRGGWSPAKEPVGKQPERYKRVEPGMVFYNPMRIMIGSIAAVTCSEQAGITSPDYVVVKPRRDRADAVWFYEWLRSTHGAQFISSLARGAVRERMLFSRLRKGVLPVPPLTVQRRFASICSVARRAQQILTAQLSDLAALPDALLREAFGGAG